MNNARQDLNRVILERELLVVRQLNCRTWAIFDSLTVEELFIFLTRHLCPEFSHKLSPKKSDQESTYDLQTMGS
ncbi:MAG: hypothetical protein HW389_3323 [Bacteroidetes bacterium]|nr:hypothetical protein [Bacteroidota bacterium]